jgi:hypothetical protein
MERLLSRCQLRANLAKAWENSSERNPTTSTPPIVGVCQGAADFTSLFFVGRTGLVTSAPIEGEILAHAANVELVAAAAKERLDALAPA